MACLLLDVVTARRAQGSFLARYSWAQGGGSLANRHREAELHAGAFIVRRPDPSAMSLDDGPANRQAHAKPVLLGRIKGLEQATDAFRVRARSDILDGNQRVIRFVPLGVDGQQALAAPDRSHRLEAIDREIE